MRALLDDLITVFCARFDCKPYMCSIEIYYISGSGFRVVFHGYHGAFVYTETSKEWSTFEEAIADMIKAFK